MGWYVPIPTIREREDVLSWFGCSRVDVGVHILSGAARVALPAAPPPIPLGERTEDDRRALQRCRYRDRRWKRERSWLRAAERRRRKG